MERRFRTNNYGPQLYPQTAGTQVEGLRSKETYWVDLGALRQEHLNDVTAIYCQVFGKVPEDLTGGLEIEPLIRDITGGMGYHEARIVGNTRTPGVDVRRMILGSALAPRLVVRFGATLRGEAFQEAVDDYLKGTAGIARPLSIIKLER